MGRRLPDSSDCEPSATAGFVRRRTAVRMKSGIRIEGYTPLLLRSILLKNGVENPSLLLHLDSSSSD